MHVNKETYSTIKNSNFIRGKGAESINQRLTYQKKLQVIKEKGRESPPKTVPQDLFLGLFNGFLDLAYPGLQHKDLRHFLTDYILLGSKLLQVLLDIRMGIPKVASFVSRMVNSLEIEANRSLTLLILQLNSLTCSDVSLKSFFIWLDKPCSCSICSTLF